jgi:signal transduction histidine kinase
MNKPGFLIPVLLITCLISALLLFTAWGEDSPAKIDVLASLEFGGTQDAVSYAVRDGEVDAGTVRMDTLERMAAEERIDLGTAVRQYRWWIFTIFVFLIALVIAIISLRKLNYRIKQLSSDLRKELHERKCAQEELFKLQKLESGGLPAGEFAHDFNNILTVILGNIYFTKMSFEPESETYKALTEAEIACRQGSNLTRQILSFSRGGAPIKKTMHIEKLPRQTAQAALV